MSNIVILSDRIKELSHTQGQGAFTLDGKIPGFSPFGDFYEYGDAVFYAATDGTNYEVGSGEYILDGSTNKLTRFPFRSSALNSGPYYLTGASSRAIDAGVEGVFHPLYLTKSAALSVAGANGVHTHTFSGYPGQTFYMPNNHAGHGESAVHAGTSGVNYNASGLPFNFPDAGIKEVYVTYPGKYSVYTGFGMDDIQEPRISGVAIWGSENVLNYDSEIVWSDTGNMLGINQINPAFALDIGGDIGYSQIRSSGFFGGGSGVFFSGGLALPQDNTKTASGGRQLEPFFRNELDNDTGTDAVFFLSGLVDQRLCSHTQSPGTVFSGPASGCGCDPAVPTFRFLTLDDIPDLSTLYVVQDKDMGIDANSIPAGSVALYKESGVITYDPDNGLFFNAADNRLGIGTTAPRANLDVVGTAHVSGDVLVSGDAVFGQDITVSGDLFVKGTTTFIDSTNVTIHDKQLELASLSGNPIHDDIDSLVDDGGILVRSSGDGNVDTGDKKWTWRESSNTWRSATSNGENLGITTSGLIFNDGSSISGAYHMGSGLTLHDDIEINVGNLFQASGSDHNTAYIHQNGILHVSGISGIATELIPLADGGARIIINPHELSGVLSNISAYDHWKFTDGKVAPDNITTTETVTISGVSGILTHYDPSTNELVINASGLSGVMQHNFDNLAGGYGHWKLTDGKTEPDNITSTQTVTISGISGIITNYNSSTNTLELSASGLSGVLRYDIDNSTGSYGWNFTDGLEPADAIASADTLTISGVSGILTHYDSSSNTLHLNPSGLSGVLSSGIAEQSGVFRYEIENVNLGNVTAGSGLIKDGSVIHMDINGSGALSNLLFKNNKIKIGSGVFENHTESLSGIAIGVDAGAQISGVDDALMIGDTAGSGLTDSNRAIVIGSAAGHASSGSSDIVLVGSNAGKNSHKINSSVIIGKDAGVEFYQASTHDEGKNNNWGSIYEYEDTIGGKSDNYLIAIGNRAASGVYGYADNRDEAADTFQEPATIAIGSKALANVRGMSSMGAIALGYEALTNVSGVVKGLALGNKALTKASGIKFPVAVGEFAGRNIRKKNIPTGSTASSPVAIGYYALANNYAGNYVGPVAIGGYALQVDEPALEVQNWASNDSTIAAGYAAGRFSHGSASVLVGTYAGGGSPGKYARNVLSTVVGRYAGFESSNIANLAVGDFALYKASGINTLYGEGSLAIDRGAYFTHAVGRFAGAYSYSQDYSTMIGHYAGYRSKGKGLVGNNVFIGYAAGYKLNTENSVFIGNGSVTLSTDPEYSWTLGESNITKIRGFLTEQNNHIVLGKAPTSLSEATDVNLKIRPVFPSIPSVRIDLPTAGTADQLQSTLIQPGDYNTIINRFGHLEVPIAISKAGSGSSSELYTSTTQTSRYKINKTDGVVAIYKESSSVRYWVVCLDGAWYRTANLDQLL